MSCAKYCVSLSPETLAQMDYLRDYLHLNPVIKRSQLLQQIVYELYMRCHVPVSADAYPVDGHAIIV